MKYKIGDYLKRNAYMAAQDRLARLIEINAPQVMIERQKDIVFDLKKGNFKVGGDESLLELFYTDLEWKKGNMGKPYCEFDNGVKYFPNAQYGRFITV